MLLLGVDHQYNSTIHIGEDYGGDNRFAGKVSPEAPKQIELIHPQLGSMQVLVTSMMGNCVLAQHSRLDQMLRERGVQREGLVGEAACRLVKGSHVVDACVDIMKADGSFVHRL